MARVPIASASARPLAKARSDQTYSQLPNSPGRLDAATAQPFAHMPDGRRALQVGNHIGHRIARGFPPRSPRTPKTSAAGARSATRLVAQRFLVRPRIARHEDFRLDRRPAALLARQRKRERDARNRDVRIIDVEPVRRAQGCRGPRRNSRNTGARRAAFRPPRARRPAHRESSRPVAAAESSRPARRRLLPRRPRNDTIRFAASTRTARLFRRRSTPSDRCASIAKNPPRFG